MSVVRSTVGLTCALMALAHGVLVAHQAANTDQEKLQGIWRVLVVETEGRYLPDEEAAKYKIVIANDKLLLFTPGKRFLTDVKLEPKASPKTIDLNFSQGNKFALGIYELDADSLKISYVALEGGKRPTKFVTEDGLRNVVLFMERTQPAPGEKSAAELIKQLQDTIPRQSSATNLRQLGIAMHNYHNDYNFLPQPATYGKDGKPLLSWRVAILPYLGEDQLYKQFKLDEPWDSPANKPLLARIPEIYAPSPGDPFATYYRVFVSTANAKPGGMFIDKGTVTLGQLTVQDGTSNTVMIVEAGDPVPWTKPDDLDYDPTKPVHKLGGLFANGFHCCFGDCSTRFFKKDIVKDEAALRAIITRNGGELVDLKKYLEP